MSHTRNENEFAPKFLTSKVTSARQHAVQRDPDERIPYAVIILNEPFGDRRRLVDICMGYVRKHYEQLGTKIIHDPDQYSTDLTKSLRCARDHFDQSARNCHEDLRLTSDPECVCTVILGGIGGRFDQGFSQLHHLYRAAEDETQSGGQIFLVNAQSICFLLLKGLNKIVTPVGPGQFAENVGIIPLGRPSIISTHGLEWDVKDWYTEFGGQLSTSNHIKANSIDIESSERVLFTIEFDNSLGENTE
ncbi:MAG: hypothetical protein Q9220_003844 [cf. Caloplaca sp. 1 TL-2023]